MRNKNQDVFVKITNQGEIDKKGFHLMGVTNKRNEDKIGFFGSGNKYAIALLLREKIPFRIFSGIKEITISTEPVMFRGQLFEQIILDGEKTSLTTSMGVDWETWFAIREIYCNALDEGETDISITKKVKPKEGKTSIFIQLTDELREFFKDINNYILVNYKPVDKAKTYYGEVEVIEKTKEEFICFRKGIRIYPENKIKSLYWYNFQNIEINESRVYKYEHQIKERIASYFTVTEERELILNLLNNWENNFEENLYWREEGDYVRDNFSPAWHSLLKGKRIYPKSIAIKSGDFEGKHNSFIVPDELAEKIAREINGCEVIGKSKDKSYESVEELDKEKEERLIQALIELEEIGYGITSEIEIVNPYMEDVVGWYEKKTDTIFLANEHLTSVKNIKNTLLEEYFHSKGLVDGQREFVTFLINEIIKIAEKNYRELDNEKGRR